MFLILSILRAMPLRKNAPSHISFVKSLLRWLHKHSVSRYQRNKAMMLKSATFSASNFASASRMQTTKELCLTDIYSRSARYFYCNERPAMGASAHFADQKLVLE